MVLRPAGCGVVNIARDNMTKSLYYLTDEDSGIGTSFAKEPRNDRERRNYAQLSKPISLKNDLGWHEVDTLQDMLRKADIWMDYPIDGVTLAGAEVRSSGLLQYIDLLYLKSDGGVFPAELKIGASSLDAAGQLLRYMADLDQLVVDLEFVKEEHQSYVEDFEHEIAELTHREKFDAFLEEHGISSAELLDQTGVLMDEGFKPQLRETVRYLNRQGFHIRLFRFDAYVDQNWTESCNDYLMRLDISEVAP